MRSLTAALAIATLGLFAATSHAAMITDWNPITNPTVVSVTDPAGDQSTPLVHSRDILAIYVAHDASNWYFRMDLAAAPAVNYAAGAYSIQIDDIAGAGGNTGDSGYVAAGLVGIDQIVMSHYSAGTGAYTAHHRHNVLAPTPGVDTVMLGDIGGAVDDTENDGATLQWSIPIDELNPGPFIVYGATNNIDEPTTYDITSALAVPAVPEPASLTLLVGAAALLGTRRLRR